MSLFVSCVNDRDVLNGNLRLSPDVAALGLRTYYRARSAACAFNDALADARRRGEYTIFVHQDMYLPEGWLERLNRNIALLTLRDPKWGVLGCYGVTKEGKGVGHVYSNGLGVLGGPFDYPVKVRTLDEIVLVVQHSPLLRFTEDHPGFHLYGSDICLRAEQLGLNCYVVDAFCIHNTRHNTILPEAFREGYDAIARNFPDALPVRTPCVRVTKSAWQIRRVIFRQRIAGLLKGPRTVERVADPLHFL